MPASQHCSIRGPVLVKVADDLLLQQCALQLLALHKLARKAGVFPFKVPVSLSPVYFYDKYFDFPLSEYK